MTFRHANPCPNPRVSIEAIRHDPGRHEPHLGIDAFIPCPDCTGLIRSQGATDLYFSEVGEAEMRRGAAILREGNGRKSLMTEIDAMISNDFAGRVLPFDSAAAVAFAAIFAVRQFAGRPIGFPDCQIAAIALSRGLTVATRNVADFENTGLDIVNP